MTKILILNRRDIKNPLSGGAEIFTHEIFKRLTGEFEITHFSSDFAGAVRDELIDNIRYIRRGNELTTHIVGLLFAVRQGKHFAMIIDQFNGIGFLTFFLKNSILLIHQLYGEFWEARFGRAGRLFIPLEKALLKLYRHKKAITVSTSTRRDLEKLGYAANRIHVVLNGLDYAAYSKKESFKPVVMFLGRLERTKNPVEAIEAFLLARKSIRTLRLFIAGDGLERQYLTDKYKDCPDIRFFGFVSEANKYELLREASILLIPSLREGWGQAVTQANMTGTPSIGYDVEGIRDSILDGKTGFLVPKGDVSAMADKIIYLFNNQQALKEFSGNALEYARTFSWDESAEKMKKVLLDS